MATTGRREPNRRELTDRFIRTLAPPNRKTLYWDTKQGGLCLVAQPTGHKAFKVAYRSGGQLKWYHIDRYEAIYLKEARDVARQIRARVAAGGDPHLDKMKSRQGITFQKLAEKHQNQHARKANKSWEQTANLLKSNVFPSFGTRKAKDVTKDDMRRLFRKLAEDRPVLANQVLAAVSSVYSWALSEDEPDIEVNPTTGIRRNPTKGRERALTESELRDVWPMLDDFGLVKATALRCVLLTAQRSGEILHMRGEHIDGQWWTMPGKADEETGWPGTKNHLDHRVPLSDPVMALLQELGLPERGWVFATDRGKPLGYLSDVTKKISTDLAIARFTVHDLRRTAATGMASMGIDRVTVSRILNHAEGGITALYDRHSYDQQKRHALDAWAGKLLEILSGKMAPENVIALERT